MQRIFGLVGKSLTHSFSKRFFSEKFSREGIKASYELFELEDITLLPDLVAAYPNLEGFNITFPYKEKIIPYLDEVSETAAVIGSVNCVHIRAGKLIGYNTDAYGFEESLVPLLQQTCPLHALILGTGGAAKTAKYVLHHKLNIDSLMVSRCTQNIPVCVTYADISPQIIAQHQLIIHATPLGTYPNITDKPDLPYYALSAKNVCYDMVYNPPLTAFLAAAQAQGATVKNGYDMLVLQALESWEIWNKG